MAAKIGLTCWGCGWEGRARAEYAGLHVTCKRCGTVNLMPDPVTDEIYVGDWFASSGLHPVPATQEVEVPAPANKAC